MELSLTTEEVNQILNVLAKQPFIEVNDLINNIHGQWEKQKNPKKEEEPSE